MQFACPVYTMCKKVLLPVRDFPCDFPLGRFATTTVPMVIDRSRIDPREASSAVPEHGGRLAPDSDWTVSSLRSAKGGLWGSREHGMSRLLLFTADSSRRTVDAWGKSFSQ